MNEKKYETRVIQDVLYWRNYKNATSIEEARQMTQEAKSKLSAPNVSKLLIDNRGVNDVGSPEVNAVWGEFMAWVGQNVEKNASITPSVVLKMQLNRLSREAGTYEKVRAFTSEKEAFEFLGISNFSL